MIAKLDDRYLCRVLRGREGSEDERSARGGRRTERDGGRLPMMLSVVPPAVVRGLSEWFCDPVPCGQACARFSLSLSHDDDVIDALARDVPEGPCEGIEREARAGDDGCRFRRRRTRFGGRTLQVASDRSPTGAK